MASDRKRGCEPYISAPKPLSFSRTIGAASSALPQCDQAQSPATDLAAAAHFTKSLVSSIGRNFRSGDGVHESRNFPPAGRRGHGEDAGREPSGSPPGEAVQVRLARFGCLLLAPPASADPRPHWSAYLGRSAVPTQSVAQL